MMALTADSQLAPGAADSQPRGRAALEVLLIFAVFLLHGAWPVPDVNETHYLSKAKHYWNPDWCRHDFFLNTPDAHEVFCWTFGWITKWLSLDATAWMGRLLTWALLAWSWRRLSWALLPRNWLAVLSAALFVALNENAHMAGEWVIGGVEAKGFSYVLVLLAFEAVLRGRWNRAWLWLGLASAMHAIVGGWSAIAVAVAWLASSREEQPRLRAMLPGLIGGFVLALPGLWFAVALSRGVDPQIAAEANQIYVWRLPHHLMADQFKEGFPSRHLLLWVVWLLLLTVVKPDAAGRRFRWIVNTGILLTLIGYGLVLLSHWNPTWGNALLRFYWFRMSDALVPMGVALVGLRFWRQLAESRPRAGRLWMAGLVVAMAINLAAQGSHLPLDMVWYRAPAVVPRTDKSMVYGDWRDVCKWAGEHSDADAQFITPRMACTFRWYAGRGEVVTWKDIPQNAAGIVAWWGRLTDLFAVGFAGGMDQPPTHWVESLAQVGPKRLADLAEKYHADYVILELVPDVPPLPLHPLYANPSYAVYHFARDKSPAAERPGAPK
jgi:hypothetical protein